MSEKYEAAMHAMGEIKRQLRQRMMRKHMPEQKAPVEVHESDVHDQENEPDEEHEAGADIPHMARLEQEHEEHVPEHETTEVDTKATDHPSTTVLETFVPRRVSAGESHGAPTHHKRGPGRPKKY